METPYFYCFSALAASTFLILAYAVPKKLMFKIIQFVNSYSVLFIPINITSLEYMLCLSSQTNGAKKGNYFLLQTNQKVTIVHVRVNQ